MGDKTSDMLRYAELIRNRAFQGSTLEAWTAFGSAAIALDNNTDPLSPELPTSVKVTATSDGVVGIKNPGWWGSKWQFSLFKVQVIECDPRDRTCLAELWSMTY